MRVLATVAASLLLAGCSASDPESPVDAPAIESSTDGTGPEQAAGAEAKIRVVAVDETLTYRAALQGCPGPSAMVESTYSMLDVSKAVALNLTFTWASAGAIDGDLGFRFGSGIKGGSAGPTSEEYATVHGSSPLVWDLDEAGTDAVRHADRLETTGPACPSGTPAAQAALDLVIHVAGTMDERVD